MDVLWGCRVANHVRSRAHAKEKPSCGGDDNTADAANGELKHASILARLRWPSITDLHQLIGRCICYRMPEHAGERHRIAVP